MMPNEAAKAAIPTAELVMKFCLITSVALGVLLIVLASVRHRSLELGGAAIPIIAVQWFFYLMVKAKKKSPRNRD